jgi:hypothetical protein
MAHAGTIQNTFLEFSHEKLRGKVSVFPKRNHPMLKKTQIFNNSLSWVNRNGD